MKQWPNMSLQMVNVSQSDVEKMLDCYDSGMSDRSTSNAIALALKDLLKPGYRVRVIRDLAKGGGCAHVGDYEIALPDELLDWLERAERASPVDPISFRAALPADWLQKPIEEPSRKTQKPIRDEQISQVA